VASLRKPKIDSLHAIDHDNQLKIYNLLFEQEGNGPRGVLSSISGKIDFVRLLNTGDRFEME